jgi:hypothetical protein
MNARERLPLRQIYGINNLAPMAAALAAVITDKRIDTM